jgi:hypothetical protein
MSGSDAQSLMADIESAYFILQGDAHPMECEIKLALDAVSGMMLMGGFEKHNPDFGKFS